MAKSIQLAYQHGKGFGGTYVPLGEKVDNNLLTKYRNIVEGGRVRTCTQEELSRLVNADLSVLAFFRQYVKEQTGLTPDVVRVANNFDVENGSGTVFVTFPVGQDIAPIMAKVREAKEERHSGAVGAFWPVDRTDKMPVQLREELVNTCRALVAGFLKGETGYKRALYLLNVISDHKANGWPIAKAIRDEYASLPDDVRASAEAHFTK